MEYDTTDVVNHAINGDIADLEKAFNSVMHDKINNAFETRKQEIGQSLGVATEED